MPDFYISGNPHLDVIMILPHPMAGHRGRLRVEDGKVVGREEKGEIVLAITLDDGREIFGTFETVRLLNPVFREITIAMWEKKE